MPTDPEGRCVCDDRRRGRPGRRRGRYPRRWSGPGSHAPGRRRVVRSRARRQATSRCYRPLLAVHPRWMSRWRQTQADDTEATRHEQRTRYRLLAGASLPFMLDRTTCSDCPRTPIGDRTRARSVRAPAHGPMRPRHRAVVQPLVDARQLLGRKRQGRESRARLASQRERTGSICP